VAAARRQRAPRQTAGLLRSPAPARYSSFRAVVLSVRLVVLKEAFGVCQHVRCEKLNQVHVCRGHAPFNWFLAGDVASYSNDLLSLDRMLDFPTSLKRSLPRTLTSRASAVVAVAMVGCRLLFLALAATCSAFHIPSLAPQRDCSERQTRPAAAQRREVLAAAAGALALQVAPQAALASGGATAGKTTSIPRAKLRYYGRITEVVIAFQALGSAISMGEGTKQAAASFFAEGDDTPMSELKTAGYLLSVAFKIDGKIPVRATPSSARTDRHAVLLTAHCSLLTAHCSLLTAHCSLLAVRDVADSPTRSSRSRITGS
jgi:hypothetical protein